MPELPEVEAARKAVHENCCGRLILEATVANDSIVIESVAPSVVESALVGRTIVGAHRKGKNIWLELDARPWPSFQFGMTGAFSIKGKEITKYKRSAVSDKEEWPSKFSKVFLKLDDGLEISFTDKRRLARVRLLDDPPAAPPISQLGPDAFLDLPEETTFISSIFKKKGPIKALIMDQSFLAGIGNWVADEVLYQARIHPEQVACSLSETECIRLHKTIQEILKLSVEVNADSEMFPKDWIFHYRWNKKPGEVAGEKISFITVGGRTSAYVPSLQKCTSQSSRKKSIATDVEVEDVGAENVTTNIKHKRERKQQISKAAISQSDEGLVPSQVSKRSKASTKESLSATKAESAKGRRSKKSTFKQTVEEEKESKSVVLKGKKAGKASKSSNRKEESAESLLESDDEQGKAPAKKQSSEVDSTAINAQIKKVRNKATATRSKIVEVIQEEEEPKVKKGEVPKTSKKKQSQKRKRGGK